MFYFFVLLFFLRLLFSNLLVESKSNILHKNNFFLNKIDKSNVLFKKKKFLKKNISLKSKKKIKKKCEFNIVIDPGHGGYDPGAIGYNGSKEKDITLLISKKLFNFFSLNKKFNVFLIRSEDNFVSLKNRLRIARLKNANLFLSIHVNSIYNNKYIKGASFWLLPMLNKNKNKYLYGKNKLNYFLLNINKKRNLNLALEIINKFRNVILLHKNYLQYADLFILSLFYVPSILIEVGYISNPTEEKKLLDELYQYKLAKYIYLGVNNFTNKLCKF